MSEFMGTFLSWIALAGLGVQAYSMFNEKKKTIKEDWFVGSKMNEVKVDALTRDNNGAWWSKPQNNQQQLPYDSTGNSSVSLKPSNSSYFYQVPGTMQSSLPPRIIPEGLSKQVQWNLPQVPNMAAEPFNKMFVRITTIPAILRRMP